MAKLKNYRVYIDIAEIMNIEATSQEEAVKKVEELLSQEERVWGVDDAEIKAELDE